MKRFQSLKALALITVLGSFAVAGSAHAYHEPDPKDIILGIIGHALSDAIHDHKYRKHDRDYDRYCRRLDRRCYRGNNRACRRFERDCLY